MSVQTPPPLLKGPGDGAFLRGILGCTKLLLASALLVLLVAPSATVRAAAELTVTTTSDATNGDVRTVAGLIVNPGPDGVSLREALEATNNDPGSYTIRFATALTGTTIAIDSELPPLTGGGVTVEGDVDGNGRPDLTLRATGELSKSCCEHHGLQISSSGNRLDALTLQGFGVGVNLQPFGKRMPSQQTFADNVVSALVLRGIGRDGIRVGSFANISECGLPKPPCRFSIRWANTSLTGNTIEARRSGINFYLAAVGDRVEGATVTDNAIRTGEAGIERNGLGIGFEQGGNVNRAWISDVLIARNTIEGVNGDAGIRVAPGTARAQANSMERVRILDNRVHLVNRGSYFCCQGIVVQAGSEAPSGNFPNVRPLRYPDGNVLRNVQVRGNSISGTLAWGVSIQAGTGAGGSRNQVENVGVERNVIRSDNLGIGVYLWEAEGYPFKRRLATGNRISGITIDENRITISGRNRLNFDFGGDEAGVLLLAGGKFGRANAVRDVRITKNRIAAPNYGIRIFGGSDNARGNSVRCVRIADNRITGTRTAMRVSDNVRGASGNHASLGGC